MEIQQELNNVFREVFNNPGIQIQDEMTSKDIIGWDSFSHMNLITAIEIHFEIEFSQSEAIGFKTVGELIQSIESNVNKH